jgi:hypothetical protein
MPVVTRPTAASRLQVACNSALMRPFATRMPPMRAFAGGDQKAATSPNAAKLQTVHNPDLAQPLNVMRGHPLSNAPNQ